MTTEAREVSAPLLTRTPLHTRAVTYRGFARSDGLWDIEGLLRDTRDYAFDDLERGTMQPGALVHELLIKVTVDDELTIVNIETGMSAVPFGECVAAADPMRRLIGARMGRGWRKTINAAIGGAGGCTHMRELLFNLATAAIHTIPSYKEHRRHRQGHAPAKDGKVPHFIGQCVGWRRDGPVVQRIYPQFFAPRLKPVPDLEPS